MTWILVLYIYAGAMAQGDSVAITNVPGFVTQAKCEEAGNLAKPLVNGSSKVLRFVCLPMPKA